MATEATFDVATPKGRRWRRYRFTAPVRLTVEKYRRRNVLNARGSQMNNGGLAVSADDKELTIGDEAEIRFMPPHFYPFVRLRGVIRNRAGDLYGVEFQTTSAAEERQLGLFRQILARWDARAQQAPGLVERKPNSTPVPAPACELRSRRFRGPRACS